MPLRFRILPSTHQTSGSGRGPSTERTVDLPDEATEIRIGRRADLELPLPFSILSSVHARLVRGQGPNKDGWILEDLGSRNGTFLAGDRLKPGEKRRVSPGAQFSLAHVDLVFEGAAAAGIGSAIGSEGTESIARRLVSDLFSSSAEPSAPTVVVVSGAPTRSVLRLDVLDRAYVVGRVESCDLRLPVDEISREHASFTRRWDGVFVSDMGSKNGVRVSGVLAGSQRVRDGDLIQIGPVSLRLFDPEDRYLREFEARSDGRAAPVAPTPASGVVAAPALHPAIAGAVAAEKKEPSAPVPEPTGVRAPRSASVATLVAALVLAVIAAVTVALLFG
jgi:pSer/pThr/pTyr-binding forkhead associated (FHA) protein